MKNRARYPTVKQENRQREFTKEVNGVRTDRLSQVLIAVFLVLLILAYSPRGVIASEQPDTLYVSISGSVTWNTLSPEADHSALVRWSEGTYSFSVTGVMVRDEDATPTVSKKGQFFKPALRYAVQSMNCSYSFEERLMQNIEDCPLVHEYKAGGGGDVADSARLAINLFSSMAQPFMENLSESEKQFLAQMQQNSMAMPDYYEFAVGGPGSDEKAQGRVQTSKPGKKCAYRDAEKDLPGFAVGLMIKLPASGVMEGSRTWSAEARKEPPTLKMNVCELGDITGDEPLTPSGGTHKNVTYTLNWSLGDSPPQSPQPEEKKDCEEVRKRVRFVERVIEAYADLSLRQAVAEQCGSDEGDALNEYQKQVEERVMDETHTGSDPPPRAKSLMWCSPWYSLPGGEGDITKITIDASVGGENVNLIEYDADGNEVKGDYDAIEELLTQWENAHGEDAGRNLFNAALEHEKVHVQQYAKSGYPRTIDDRAEYELEAFTRELDYLLQALVDMGC